MPIVRVEITEEELSRAQKEEIAQRMTDVLVDVLQKNPATTHVVVSQIPVDAWAIAGELVDQRRARASTSPTPAPDLGSPLGFELGRASRDRRLEARSPDRSGAHAALETFYHAFNQRSLSLLEDVWAPDASVTLANPLGGVLTGITAIKALYGRVFDGPARVWVEYHDVTEYVAGGHALFVGRERGEFELGATKIVLTIRTTRYFRQLPGIGWRQVHHHGSIDDAALLAAYQQAVSPAKP